MHLGIKNKWIYFVLLSVFNVFLFGSFDIRKNVFCYWQGDGGSLLTTRFMTIIGQKHKVLKLQKRVFAVFVEICVICNIYVTIYLSVIEYENEKQRLARKPRLFWFLHRNNTFRIGLWLVRNYKVCLLGYWSGAYNSTTVDAVRLLWKR